MRNEYTNRKEGGRKDRGIVESHANYWGSRSDFPKERLTDRKPENGLMRKLGAGCSTLDCRALDCRARGREMLLPPTG